MPYSDPHIVETTVVELANTDDNVSVLEVTLARDIKCLISEGFANGKLTFAHVAVIQSTDSAKCLNTFAAFSHFLPFIHWWPHPRCHLLIRRDL